MAQVAPLLVAIVCAAGLAIVRLRADPFVQQRASTTTKVATAAKCSADLGIGVQTQIRFCDVVIASAARDGVVVTVPPNRAAPTLRFDLHNRFTVVPAALPTAQVFGRHTATVAVIRPTGEVIERAVISGEFRSVNDLFDRLSAGRGASGVKAVGPGKPEQISVTLPVGLTSASIVGVKLEVMGRSGQDVFDSPGRPVAIVSNWRVEYVPR